MVDAEARQSRIQSMPAPLPDDPTLADLAVAVLRRWPVALLGWALTIGLACLVGWWWSRSYTLTTVVDLGRYAQSQLVTGNGGINTGLIEQPEAAAAKIQRVFLPDVMRVEGAAYLVEEGTLPDLKVEVVRGGSVVILTSKAKDASKERFTRLHQTVVGRLIADHNELFARLRDTRQGQLKELDAGISESQRRLERLASLRANPNAADVLAALTPEQARLDIELGRIETTLADRRLEAARLRADLEGMVPTRVLLDAVALRTVAPGGWPVLALSIGIPVGLLVGAALALAWAWFGSVLGALAKQR